MTLPTLSSSIHNHTENGSFCHGAEFWVSDSVIFQLYHGENKLIFNKMMMRSTLY
jgi:hypothetical protein